ncbi:sigma-54 dependent transcriptional regulator [Piscinibacter sp.]|uniref:sigma-54 dependent transcriptional regulator n=1 Tax=Piscinibacter sp. TaxID=1903157 RepID=UPI002BD63390|nr:sigma-54 dependent transcriptional regulator [Albitalea sp.]HUG24189.1 sigma-54 dependent transcriptional regulator [Albitalea sp.]
MTRHPLQGDASAVWAQVAAHIVGCSEVHCAMLAQLCCIAASEAPTLIEGETGSGKEVAARAIHYGGPRRAGPFVPVNCGALPEGLIESELFGVERGAFTDARQARRGLVAEARGGTLFLDEVDALSPKAQVTLLRFLQDQRYRPVGTARDQCTDARVIAATNQPLDELIVRREFRSDLLYRLKILHLVLPPLRERAEDVELLARHFVGRLQSRYGGPERDIHPETLQWLRRYEWPGNVRELENWVHRRFLMSSGRMITHDDRLPPPATSGTVPALPLVCFQRAKAEAVQRFERDYLLRVMHETDGNVTRAAQLAGKERRAFGKLLKKHGIGRASAH